MSKARLVSFKLYPRAYPMSTSPTVSKHKRKQWRKGFLKKDKADKADKADEADKGKASTTFRKNCGVLPKDKGQEKADKADDCHTSSSSSNEPWGASYYYYLKQRAAEKGTKRYEGVTLDGREEALEFPYFFRH